MNETFVINRTADRPDVRPVADTQTDRALFDALGFDFSLRPMFNLRLGRSVAHEAVITNHQLTTREQQSLIKGMAPLEIEINRYIRLVHALLDNHVLVGGHSLILPIRPRLPGVTYRGLGSLLDRVAECVLPAERLVLQIDEGPDNTDVQQARLLMRALRERGYRVSVSGFGSGFEGLKELITCPPDFLRLSPELTSKLLDDRAQRSVVKAICGVAQDLDISVVADQVNCAAVASLLQQMGVVLQLGSHHGAARSLGTPLA